MNAKDNTELLGVLQEKVATLLDSYFPDHKDCECSRCLAFIYGLLESAEEYVANHDAKLEQDLLKKCRALSSAVDSGLSSVVMAVPEETIKTVFHGTEE